MKKILLFCLLLATIGCQTIDPYTGESKTNNTSKGAGIGAATGAALGAIVNHKDRKKGAIVGALAGGAIGAGAGHYMDKQETVLRQQLQGSGVQVARDGDSIRLIMPGNITFASSSYDIRPEFFEVLNSVAVVVNKYDQTQIKISGHTDSKGSPQYNETLSNQRAASVGSYLKGQKVAAGRVSTYGYGFSYPIAGNDTEAGRQQNRRVEIELQPIQQ
jgi:outer membrane protein OmpA-like peptidoglycan-associated protein